MQRLNRIFAGTNAQKLIFVTLWIILLLLRSCAVLLDKKYLSSTQNDQQTRNYIVNDLLIMSLSKREYKKQKTNGPVAHQRLFVLSKLMVTFLKNETYGYGSRYSLIKKDI